MKKRKKEKLIFRMGESIERFNIREEEGDEDEEQVPYHWLEGDSLAPPCQTEYEIVETILQIVRPYVNEKSVLYDLGCGDGRICLAASQYLHCFSVGVEIESQLVERFKAKIKAKGLDFKVKALNQDLREIFLDDANVIVLYLLPESIELIRDKLLHCLSNNCVVLCNSWGLKGIQPISVTECGFANNVKLFLYTKDSLL
jgi:SAM-dependent methyltransferase